MKIRIGTDGLAMLCAVLLCEQRATGAILLCAATVHELGHLVAAKILGVRLRELRLGFAGARLYPEGDFIPYKKEIILALAGPLSSFISSLLAFLIAVSHPSGEVSISEEIYGLLNGQSASATAYVMLFCIASLLQGILNLLPIESLDGGRALSAAVSLKFSEHAASVMRRVLTALSAVCLWLFSVYLLLRTGSGIGIFFSAICIFARFIM